MSVFISPSKLSKVSQQNIESSWTRSHKWVERMKQYKTANKCFKQQKHKTHSSSRNCQSLPSVMHETDRMKRRIAGWCKIARISTFLNFDTEEEEEEERKQKPVLTKHLNLWMTDFKVYSSYIMGICSRLSKIDWRSNPQCRHNVPPIIARVD